MFSRRLGDSSVATGSALRHTCLPVLRVFLCDNVDKERVKVLHVLRIGKICHFENLLSTEDYNRNGNQCDNQNGFPFHCICK